MNTDLPPTPPSTFVVIQGGPCPADEVEAEATAYAYSFPPGWTVERKGSGWRCKRAYVPGVVMPATLFGDDLDELRRIAQAMAPSAA